MTENTFYYAQTSRREWWLVAITGALTLVCGSIGIWEYEHTHATEAINPYFCLLGALYHSLQMLILHTPHFEKESNCWIEAGRWFGAATLVATTWMLLWKRLTYEFRLLRLTDWHGHHVVCGLGQKGMDVVCCLKKTNPNARIVVLDPHPEQCLADECAALGVCVIMEDATKPEVLERARVALAEEVIVITPEDETNVRIDAAVRQECAHKATGNVKCFVHLSNIHLREELEKISGARAEKGTRCVQRFFDVFDDEARRVLTKLRLDGDGIPPRSGQSVHVVILGFGRMGRSLALRAVKMGHFANGKLLRISVIDSDAERQREHFLFRYPVLEGKTATRPAICDLDFHQADAQSISARKLIEGWAAEADTLLHVFICVDNNTSALELGLRYRESLARYPHRPLHVRIKTRSSIKEILENPAKSRPPIETFGMVEDGCCERTVRKEHNEAFARAAHQDFVRKRNVDSNRSQKGDEALDDWHNLREDLRESNRQQGDHAYIKLRAINCEAVDVSDTRKTVTHFTDQEIELLAELEHTRWNAERWLAGWRFGAPSNKPERISENLRPWADLDESIKKYDREAVANIPGIFQMMKPPLKIVRKAALDVGNVIGV